MSDDRSTGNGSTGNRSSSHSHHSVDPIALDPQSEAIVATLGSGVIRLRIAGLGHSFELDAAPTATLGDLKEEIERKIHLPSPYQRLVAKRKKLDDDTMVLGPTIMDGGNTIISMGIGIEDRTKILLLHSPAYENDREGIDKLTTLMKEIHKIDAKRRTRDMDNKTVQELIIQICCKIDCVETNGSEPLRAFRKSTVRKAEGVAKKSEEDSKNRGVDP